MYRRVHRYLDVEDTASLEAEDLRISPPYLPHISSLEAEDAFSYSNQRSRGPAFNCTPPHSAVSNVLAPPHSPSHSLAALHALPNTVSPP